MQHIFTHSSKCCVSSSLEVRPGATRWSNRGIAIDDDQMIYC